MAERNHELIKQRTANTGLAKVAVQCSADTFVVNQTLVLRINICCENATFAKPETVVHNTMKKITKILIFSFITLILISCKTSNNSKNPNENAPKVEFSSFDFGESEFPKQKRVVNDFEFVFSLEELEKLTRIIREFEKKSSNQIAIVSIKSIKSYDDFDKYAIDLSNNWGVGQKGKDNGLTIVFSKTLRKIRISTGTGTEKFLSDKDCKIIIDETIIPEFKNGKFYDGIEKGLYQLINKWE